MRLVRGPPTLVKTVRRMASDIGSPPRDCGWEIPFECLPRPETYSPLELLRVVPFLRGLSDSRFIATGLLASGGQAGGGRFTTAAGGYILHLVAVAVPSPRTDRILSCPSLRRGGQL